MNDLFYRLKNLPLYLCLPFAFCSVILLAVNALSVFGADIFEQLYSGLSEGISALFAAASGIFISYYICKSTKKAAAAAAAVLFFDAALFSLCQVHISFALGIVISLLFAYVFSRNSIISGFALCTLISLALALFAGLLNDVLFSLLKAICGALKGRGALFGAADNLFSLLFSNRLSELFLTKEYSGTAFSNGKIVSGVLNLFEAQGKAGINAAKYLSGKYFVNIFACSALFFLLFKRLSPELKGAFSLCFALGAVFGDIRLFSLFILIYNPLLYLALLLITSVSYFTAYLLDIRIMHFSQGSLIELIRHSDNMLYFLLAGSVIAVLTYFFGKIVLSKFDFQSRKILPPDVKRLFGALGGEENIERINGSALLVKNPNLINILRLDCEIKGNLVILDYDDLELIKRFY